MGEFNETDYLEAVLLEEISGTLHVCDKALDGCLVRLMKRWENKQFDGRVASFSRLKLLLGERGKEYRLRVTWYERLPNGFREVASIDSPTSFTIGAHHPSKRGSVDSGHPSRTSPKGQRMTFTLPPQSPQIEQGTPAPATQHHSAVTSPAPAQPQTIMGQPVHIVPPSHYFAQSLPHHPTHHYPQYHYQQEQPLPSGPYDENLQMWLALGGMGERFDHLASAQLCGSAPSAGFFSSPLSNSEETADFDF